MQFQLTIELDESIMQDGVDVALALRKVADNLAGNIAATPLDMEHADNVVNEDGAVCGSWHIIDPTPPYKPGYRCRMFKEDGQPRVEHYQCDEHPDFTVTNPITGEVIRGAGDK